MFAFSEKIINSGRKRQPFLLELLTVEEQRHPILLELLTVAGKR